MTEALDWATVRDTNIVRVQCGFSGCRRGVNARDLCAGHYNQWREGRPLAPLRVKRSNTQPKVDCSITGCSNPAEAYRMCHKHNQRAACYSLTPLQLDMILASPKCRICGSTDMDEVHIDHDHSCCAAGGTSCGRCIRGILCGHCNRGLGMFKDSPELLISAARYLITT